jgi:hypothetical protein
MVEVARLTLASQVVALAFAAAVGLNQGSDPVKGCLPAEALQAQLAEFARKDWKRIARSDLASVAGFEPTARNADTNDVVALARRGRVHDGRLECGETLAFDVRHSATGVAERLKYIAIAHTVPSRDDAEQTAKALIEAIRAPQLGPASGVDGVHLAEPEETLADVAWKDDRKVHNVLKIGVKQVTSGFLVTLFWSQPLP